MCWPSFSLDESTPGLAASRSARVTPYFLAMLLKLSPATMIWVPPWPGTTEEVAPEAPPLLRELEPRLATCAFNASMSVPCLVMTSLTCPAKVSTWLRIPVIMLVLASTLLARPSAVVLAAVAVSEAVLTSSASAFNWVILLLLLKDMNSAMAPITRPRTPRAVGTIELAPDLEEESTSIIEKEEGDENARIAKCGGAI